jgi:hypothetical protein
LVAAGWVMAFLLVDTGTREELLDLGAGGWLNIPMFGSIALGYGYASQWIFDRVQPEVIQEFGKVAV